MQGIRPSITPTMESLKTTQAEFFNKKVTSFLPPHCLKVKKGTIIMLLRNLDASSGLCNFDRRSGIVLIPKIYNYDDENLPFRLRRAHLPIRLAFAVSINKAKLVCGFLSTSSTTANFVWL